jgi:hypothetical protein
MPVDTKSLTVTPGQSVQMSAGDTKSSTVTPGQSVQQPQHLVMLNRRCFDSYTESVSSPRPAQYSFPEDFCKECESIPPPETSAKNATNVEQLVLNGMSVIYCVSTSEAHLLCFIKTPRPIFPAEQVRRSIRYGCEGP